MLPRRAPWWTLAWIAGATACLARYAQVQPEGREAERYALSLRAEIATISGLDSPPVFLAHDGELTLTWARQWRDGSIGWLVEIDAFGQLRDLRTVAPGAQVSDPAPTPALPDARLELRAFPDGRLVTVRGAEPWVGVDGHLEIFDPLWWMLVPPAPDRAVGDSLQSWAWSITGLPEVRWEQRLAWTRDRQGRRREYAYAGATQGRSAVLAAEGTVAGAAAFDGARLDAHHLELDRTVTTRWPASVVVQSQRLVLDLRWVGTVRGPAIRHYPFDDPYAEREPLTLADGTVIGTTRVDPARAEPYLVATGSEEERRRALGLPFAAQIQGADGGG